MVLGCATGRGVRQGSKLEAENTVRDHRLPLKQGTWDASATALQDKMHLLTHGPWSRVVVSSDRVFKEVIM